MRINKIIPIFIVSCLLLVASCKLVFAQREMDDYNYQYEKYQEIHKNYLKFRDAYLQYQTLTSQEELVEPTRDFLTSRDRVIRTYLLALKYFLDKTPSVTSDQKKYFVLTVDSENTWLSEHEKTTSNLTKPTLDELLAISLRVENRQKEFYKLAYQILSNMLLGKMRSLKSESEAINFLLADRINKDGKDKDLVTLNQWLETVKEGTYQAGKNIEMAEFYFGELDKKDDPNAIATEYQQIKGELEKAKSALRGNINYQQEILREVER